MEKNGLKIGDPIIVECNIEPYPRLMPEGMFDKMPEVKARFDNGEEKTLFDFFPDVDKWGLPQFRIFGFLDYEINCG